VGIEPVENTQEDIRNLAHGQSYHRTIKTKSPIRQYRGFVLPTIQISNRFLEDLQVLLRLSE